MVNIHVLKILARVSKLVMNSISDEEALADKIFDHLGWIANN